MIDAHCHLEQKDYGKERGKIIEQCKRELNAVVTCSAHPDDFNLTLEISKENPRFVYCTAGIHPEYIKDLSEEQISKAIKEIGKRRNLLVGIGEVGLDYYWIKEPEMQEKQKALFRRMIQLAKELELPLIIHSRDAREDTMDILEEEGMKGKKVLMHLFTDREYLQRVIDNGWFISIGPNIAKSKDRMKIARDMPLNRIMLETDSPWFRQEGQKYGVPVNVKIACEKIAEAKKINILEVERQTDLNATGFFGL